MKPIALMKTAAMLAALGLCVSIAPARAAQSTVSGTDARTIASLMKELDQAEAELTHVEDVAAIKKLQRAYNFYIDKGMWADAADLFTNDAVADYAVGAFVGKKSISQHFFQNLGDGRIGLPDGKLYDHMVLQPVVDVAADGKSAKGRWRELALLGQMNAEAGWAGGIYENTYVKERGVWKIKDLHYYVSFNAPYEGGWGNVKPLPVAARPPAAGGPGGAGPGGAGPGGAGGAAPGGAPGGGAAAGGARGGAGGPPGAGAGAPGGAAGGGRPAANPAAFVPTAMPVPPPTLRHMPDRPHDQPCPGFPAACIEPYHYSNPVTGRGNTP